MGVVMVGMVVGIMVVMMVVMAVLMTVIMAMMASCDHEDRSPFSQGILFRNA